MRKLIGAFALTLAVSALSSWALAEVPPVNPKVHISYDPTTAYQATYTGLKNRHVLEELQQFLAALRLPTDLTIRTAECNGALNIPYKSGAPATICYELVNEIETLVVKNVQDADTQHAFVTGAFIQAALHETALAVMDILQTPIWGRDQDAADRLAAFLMVGFDEDIETVSMLSTVSVFQWSFQASASTGKIWTGSDFASVDSPDAQRYFNFLCIAVGADYPKFGGVIQKGIIAPFRAGDCENKEYPQVRKAFDLRIMPYVDPELFVKVRSVDWLNWSPGK